MVTSRLQDCSHYLTASRRLIHDPLVKCQRRVIGIHAEAVDHPAGEVVLGAVRAPAHLLSRQRLSLLHKALVPGVVDMAVEHICARLAIFRPQVLAVVAQDRIVAEDHFALVVVQLRIGADPLEAGGVVAFLVAELVVVPLDQAQDAVELFQYPVRFVGLPQGKGVTAPHYSSLCPLMRLG